MGVRRGGGSPKGLAGAWLVLAGLGASGAASQEAVYLGEFRVSYYWVAREDERFAGLPRREILRSPDGRQLARVSTPFRRELEREGTGRLRDGRVLNVAARGPEGWRFRELEPGSWGLGVEGRLLVPFESVATDPGTIPTGARLYLPQLAQLTLPDGRVHPGRFVAADRGRSIRGNRIDVFIAEVSLLGDFERVLPTGSTTPVFLLGEDCHVPAVPERDRAAEPADLLREAPEAGVAAGAR